MKGLLVVIVFTLTTPALAQLQPFPTDRPSVVDKTDWASAQGKRSGDDDLRCVDGGSYIGGINRQWFLVISGPRRKRFYYSFDSMIGKKSFAGSYATKNGLALFTGELKATPRRDKTQMLRVGLNYRTFGKRVAFNVLWRDKAGNYQYERKWFRRKGKEWLPGEHHRLTFTPKKETAERLNFAVKGEITRWADGGRKRRQAIDHLAVYQKENAKYWRKERKQPSWLPHILQPHGAGAKPVGFHLGLPHFGWVRGFVFDAPPPTG